MRRLGAMLDDAGTVGDSCNAVNYILNSIISFVKSEERSVLRTMISSCSGGSIACQAVARRLALPRSLKRKEPPLRAAPEHFLPGLGVRLRPYRGLALLTAQGESRSVV